MDPLEQTVIELNTQINGKDGKGGLIQELSEIREKVDSLHTKFTIGVGFLTALQVTIPFWFPQLVKALGL